MSEGTRRLRVAAVQMACEAGAVAANLEQAGALIAQAAAGGAQLVLLPELMPAGYVLTEALWDGAEPVGGGPALSWLRATARRYRVYLGTTLLEAEGEDFYNAFYLAAPDGTVAGRVRKQPPASVEAYFYRAGRDSHVIETDIGRIGVGICFENLLYRRLADLHAGDVDLVLQPTSAPTPAVTFPLRHRDALAFEQFLAGAPAYTARVLGVPVVMANKCGPLATALPPPYPRQDTRFPGLSAIVDGDGVLLRQLADEQAAIVAEVTLDPARKRRTPPPAHGHWSMPVPWYAFLWRMSTWTGERAYAGNTRRKQKARAVAARALEAKANANAS